jgi:cation-transporting ATPase I
MTLLHRLEKRWTYPGRSSRRIWVGNGRVHVEVRGLTGPDPAGLAGAVEAALQRVRGVQWAQVDHVLGRVVVECVADAVGLEPIVEVLESVESLYGVGEHRFPVDGGEHPGDREPVVRHVLALGADVAGLGLGVVGRVLRATPLPVEVASVAAMVDNEPWIRQLLESHLGTPATDLGLAVANAVGQSLTQGPFGLLADGFHRVNLLVEATARRNAFAKHESRRWGDGPAGDVAGGPVARPTRRARLPDGAVERYSDRAALVGAGTATATFAATGSPRRGAAMLVAAIPKAARLGREAFATHLDRVLCERDLLVLDIGALRRLDRVDTIVIDGGLLTTGRSRVSGIRLLEDADAPEVHRHLRTMFDPTHPLKARRRGRWTLGAPDAAERQRSSTQRARRDLGASEIALLRYAGRPVAVVGIEEELSASVVNLVRSARRHRHMVAVAQAETDQRRAVETDLVVPPGAGLAGAIRGMQDDGCVVVLVAAGGPGQVEALRTADVGLELPCWDGAAWSGDIILNDVDDSVFVLDAIASAREVSRQSVALSAIGSGLGALLSIGGLPGQAAGRASSAVNLAAVAAMANGMRAAAYVARHGGRVPGDPPPWHELTTDDVLRRVASTPQGLSRQQVARRQRSDTGVQAPEPSLARSVLRELASPLMPVLAGGAAASALVGSPADAGIVAGVSALSALIGGVQRFGAERAIVSLSDASQTWVTVKRAGTVARVPADGLVPGDLIALQAGDAVPADCRILSDNQLEVDESSLTGESDTVAKSAEPTYSAVLAERTSMLYEGTTIAAGDTTAVVVAVGADTVANAFIADSAGINVSVGVEARLKELTSLTLPIAGAGGASVLGLGVLRGRSLNASVGSAVALAVAAVPEGLPVLATMAQLASARRLSRRQALVRNPRAIEALGRVRVLCTDKTGTLTEGRMRLGRVSDGVADSVLSDLSPELTAVVAAALRASPAGDGHGTLPHLTDRAVVMGAAHCGATTDTGAPGWHRQDEIPFAPARGFHAVVGAAGAGTLLSVKGAPEAVLPRCRTWQSPSGDVTVDPPNRRRLNRQVDRLARRGFRVLAVAEARVEPNGELGDDDVDGLVLLGFLMLSDPVRATAAAAVSDLGAAGVGVVMVTGDHPSTAEGIAAELGILNDHRVVTGSQLAAMTDRQLDEVITEVSVFARVTPADKVRVVQALQRRGAPVAMTGDGANDAAAIRLADVGIAVGDHAAPAARRAADLVVTDGRIETIVDAIIEGRAMWASLRDALAILLGGNLGEVVFTVAATAVSGRAPLSARQLLMVNLLTDVAPALAIALRSPPTTTPEALLAEGPDASLGHSLERAIAIRAGSTTLGAGTAWAIARLTGRRSRASTTALVALVGSQLGQTIMTGSRDPLVLLSSFGSAAILAGIVQTPGLSQFFGCVPLGPAAWSIALGSSILATSTATAAPRLLRGSAPTPAAEHDGPNGTEPSDVHRFMPQGVGR